MVKTFLSDLLIPQLSIISTLLYLLLDTMCLLSCSSTSLLLCRSHHVSLNNILYNDTQNFDIDRLLLCSLLCVQKFFLLVICDLLYNLLQCIHLRNVKINWNWKIELRFSHLTGNGWMKRGRVTVYGHLGQDIYGTWRLVTGHPFYWNDHYEPLRIIIKQFHGKLDPFSLLLLTKRWINRVNCKAFKKKASFYIKLCFINYYS